MVHILGTAFSKLYARPFYRLMLWVLGIFTLPVVLMYRYLGPGNEAFQKIRKDVLAEYEADDSEKKLFQINAQQLMEKYSFFGLKPSEKVFDKALMRIVKKQKADHVERMIHERAVSTGIAISDFCGTFNTLLKNPYFLTYVLVTSFPMLCLMAVYASPFAKYVFERLMMIVFVIAGVTVLVFTILYASPLDPAVNILGQEATAEQIASFKNAYGLDKPYFQQLFDTIKRLATLDLGKSFVGNEDVLTAIGRKFPITMILSFSSLILAVIIAIPAGILSAVKPYSAFDYTFMLFALIGISMPTFWMGLLLILQFSIENSWLPASFAVDNWKSFVMPSIVLGMALAASVARMTRSSMLEVKNMDYIVTARAKGLSERKVILRHILGNAMIPIITIVGLQFGQMLGGSAVTEKVFNINGIGSFIVDKQFVPDVPIVLAGVVYVSVVISLVNLAVDLIYAVLDPRIKSRMKNY